MIAAYFPSRSIALIFTRSSASSFRRDSISDGVSRLEVREVSGLGLGEAIEPMAGCGPEGCSEVTMFLMKGRKGCGCRAEYRAVLLAGQCDGADDVASTVLDMPGQRSEAAALRQRVIEEQMVLTGNHLTGKLGRGEDAIEAGRYRPEWHQRRTSLLLLL